MSFARVVFFLLLSAASSWRKILAWEPTWESLDSRPLPSWYDEAKFGIFIHWGVFSVPSFNNEWFWQHFRGDKEADYVNFVKNTEAPRFAYQDYAHRFDAYFYNATEWTELFANSGAQYVVLTSKHHEGFCNWDSRNIPTTWNWNAMDIGPKRDILGELANATKRTISPTTGKALHWGVYHSLFEWFNPAYEMDKANGYKTTVFTDTKTLPELYDLVKKYEPELIWSDGAWEAPDTYWKSVEFLSWYATNSSVADTAVWNDRWGNDNNCKHGAYYNCQDRYQPGKLQKKKWENALTIDAHSWGYNRNAKFEDYLSTEYFIHELIETVAYGGNMLLNVGPTADGRIDPIFYDRLLGIGAWLKVNGESIYKTQPWDVCQNETSRTSDVYYTRRGSMLYTLVTRWPTNNTLSLQYPQPTPDTEVRMLGLTTPVKWTPLYSASITSTTRRSSRKNVAASGMVIDVPLLTPDILPCQYAWVFEIRDLANVP